MRLKRLGHIPERQPSPFELLDEYCERFVNGATKRVTRISIGSLLKRVETLEQLTYAMLIEHTSGYTEYGRQIFYARLRPFLRFCVEKGQKCGVEVERVKYRAQLPPPSRIPEEEQLERLFRLRAYPFKARRSQVRFVIEQAALFLLFSTGMRPSEMLQLRERHVVRVEGGKVYTIQVQTKKGGEHRVVVVEDDYGIIGRYLSVRPALLEQREQNKAILASGKVTERQKNRFGDDPAFLLAEDGGDVYYGEWNSWEKKWSAWLQIDSVGRVARRYFAIMQASSLPAADIPRLSYALGHRNRGTTFRYIEQAARKPLPPLHIRAPRKSRVKDLPDLDV